MFIAIRKAKKALTLVALGSDAEELAESLVHKGIVKPDYRHEGVWLGAQYEDTLAACEAAYSEEGAGTAQLVEAFAGSKHGDLYVMYV